MKTVSTTALAAALIVGLGGASLVASPATAQKKEKAPKEQGFNLSKEVRASAIAAEAAIKASDVATAETNTAAIEAAAKNDDERYIAASYRFEVEKLKMNALPADRRSEASLAGPLDALIANPRTAKTDVPRFVYARGNIAYNAKQYAQAAQFFDRARTLGHQDANLTLNIARSKMEAGDIAGGAAELDGAIKAETAAGKKAPESWYRYAIARLYRANLDDETVSWTRQWLAAYGTKANWRDAIISFGFQGNGAKRLTDRQRVDLYRLMLSTKSLAGQKEYIDYADATLKIGLPTEAKAVIEEGTAAGIVPKGNMTATDLAGQARAAIAADKSFAAQETAARAAANGKAASQTGDAYLGARNYAKAIEFYRLAQTKGGIDIDAVNLHLGIAQTMSGAKDEAQANFAKVTTGANGSIAKLWTSYLIAPPVA